MTDAAVISLAQDALTTALLISGPILAVSLVIGLLVSIFQAMTQINEATLTFVPKILGVFAVSAIFGPWMISRMAAFTVYAWNFIPQVGQ